MSCLAVEPQPSPFTQLSPGRGLVMSAFSATCRRIEAPDVRIKDRRTLTAHDVVREDLSETSPYQRNFTHNVCDESFTDRDTYVAHMRECHGLSLAPMARVSTRKPRAPKAPAQKCRECV